VDDPLNAPQRGDRMAASQHRGALPQQLLFAPVVPPRRGFTKNATLYSDTSGRFGLPQSEKMFWHDGGWLKKIGIAQDILHPSGVLLAAIKPHRLDGDGQCAR